MKSFAIIVVLVLLAGCNTTGEFDTSYLWDDPQRYGYREYDPCIRCGEGWINLNIDQTQEQPK